MWSWLLAIYFASVHAETTENRYFRQLANAKSGSAIEELKETYEAQAVQRAACRIQLAEQSVPAACYEYADPAAIRRLDWLCATASRKLRINSQLGPQVSSFCRSQVREAQKVETYRSLENPASNEIGPDFEID